jgi:hypothetical protein
MGRAGTGVNDIRVVTPFRPFPPESREHQELGPFDWIDAIRMLRASVARSCHCDTVTITDIDADVPDQTFRFVTRERRLMFWILEVALRYLESPHFTVDTVMVSPDSLVFCDLRQWFAGEIGMVVRPHHPQRPILNALQWWPVASKDTLIDLYQKALAIAHTLPEDVQVWGADSKPFEKLLKPLFPGCGPRKFGVIANLIDSRQVMTPLTSEMITALQQGLPMVPPPRVVDFRFLRKRHMRTYFDATIGKAVTA